MSDQTWQEFLRNLEQVRALPPTPDLELRAADGDDVLGVMEGHFSVFNTWYEINSMWEGNFLERVAPGTFSKTIAESRDSIRVLFDHGQDMQIGNKALGPIRELREDQVGAYYEVELSDTSYNRDLLPGLRSKPPLYGASFRFRVIKDEWNEEPERSNWNPDGIPERTIKEARVFEFGPVAFPANPAATAGVRSLTDDFYDRLRSKNPDHVEDLLARSRELRTPQKPAADGTGVGGAADNPDEAAKPHFVDRSDDHASVVARISQYSEKRQR